MEESDNKITNDTIEADVNVNINSVKSDRKTTEDLISSNDDRSSAHENEDTKSDGVEYMQLIKIKASAPLSWLKNHNSELKRTDRLGTLIEHSEKEFEEGLTGSPPSMRKRKTFQVTFKDKALGESLAKVIEVESYKRYNSQDPEVKLWWIIF